MSDDIPRTTTDLAKLVQRLMHNYRLTNGDYLYQQINSYCASELSAQSSREKALEMQMAGLVEAIKIGVKEAILSVDDGSPLENIWEDAEIAIENEALANLPDVSMYRRLMEAVAEVARYELHVDGDIENYDCLAASLLRLREAFRAIKP